jgi:hypothetical protein
LRLLHSMRKYPWLWGGALAAAVVGGLLASLIRRRRAPKAAPPRIVPVAGMVQGLTDAEAAARRPAVDFDAIAEKEQRAFLSRAIRTSLFTLFNLDLFAIAILMLLLGSPWSTFLALLVLAINVCLNVLQAVVTKRRLDALLRTLRPQATVIRDGGLASVDVAEIVPGDMVVVGRGDEFFVNGVIVGDGELTIDPATASDRDRQMVKRAGDRVHAHTFCADGRAIYAATEAGAWRVAEQRGGVQLLTEEPTPLRSLLRAVLLSLLAIVVTLSLLALAGSIVGGEPLASERYRNTFALIFRVAPTSLFFILIIGYAVGVLRIANVGGLAYRSTAVESLANVSDLCLSLRSVLQGTQVTLEEIGGRDGRARVSPQFIRRMLGDLANSAPYRMSTIAALAEALPGRRRTPVEAAGHLAALGWYGISVRDPDMRGTFVIGEAALLSPHFARDEPRGASARPAPRAPRRAGPLPPWSACRKGTPAGISKAGTRCGRGNAGARVAAARGGMGPVEATEGTACRRSG